MILNRRVNITRRKNERCNRRQRRQHPEHWTIGESAVRAQRVQKLRYRSGCMWTAELILRDSPMRWWCAPPVATAVSCALAELSTEYLTFGRRSNGKSTILDYLFAKCRDTNNKRMTILLRVGCRGVCSACVIVLVNVSSRKNCLRWRHARGERKLLQFW